MYAGDGSEGLHEGEPLPVDGDDSLRAEAEQTLAVDPVEAAFVLVWVTEAVEADGYRALINEVDVYGPGG